MLRPPQRSRMDQTMRTHYTKCLAVYVFHSHYWQTLLHHGEGETMRSGIKHFIQLLQVGILACVARLERLPTEHELTMEWHFQSLCDNKGKFQDQVHVKGLHSHILYKRFIALVGEQAPPIIQSYFQNQFAAVHRQWLQKQVQSTLRCTRYSEYEWQCLAEVFHLPTSLLIGIHSGSQLMQRVKNAYAKSALSDTNKLCLIQ